MLQSPTGLFTYLLLQERLTRKNADLCDSLATTQLSRNALEREIILLKRTLLEERSKFYPQQVSELSNGSREIEACKKQLQKQLSENVSGAS